MKKNKQYELAEVTVADNYFSGIASVMGNVDSYGDVIAPGAFKKSIRSFLRSGFIALGHEWSNLPIAMPTGASMKRCENGLFGLMIEAEYHSTDDAQAARKVAAERITNGLSVGLSVCFSVPDNSVMRFDTGSKLLASLDSTEGYDIKGLRAWKKPIYLINEVDDLFEVSMVTVPANNLASVTMTKEFTLEEELETVLAAVEDVVVRLEKVRELRKLDQRDLSAERRGQVMTLSARLSQLLAPTEADCLRAELLRLTM